MLKVFSDLLIHFVWPSIFAVFEHNTLNFLIALRFALAAPNLWTELLCLTSNVYVNWRSDLIEIAFVVDIYWLGVIRLLLVNISFVETIADSIIAFYCYWYSHIPAVLYNFLMFSRNICSYKALLLNDWLTPMSTMCFSVVRTETTP